jgi:predicted site-specific integrase-resolvase
MPTKEYISIPDAAEMVGVSHMTMRSYIKQGKIKVDRVLPSGRKQFKLKTVEEFIRTLNLK